MFQPYHRRLRLYKILETLSVEFNKIVILINCLFALLRPYAYKYVYTGCPRKNVPLGEGQTSPKGTFFLGHLVYKKSYREFNYTACSHNLVA